jgi:hypothetical protein
LGFTHLHLPHSCPVAADLPALLVVGTRLRLRVAERHMDLRDHQVVLLVLAGVRAQDQLLLADCRRIAGAPLDLRPRTSQSFVFAHTPSPRQILALAHGWRFALAPRDPRPKTLQSFVFLIDFP